MANDGINRRNIAKLTRNIQKEFNKRPVRVPVEVDGPELGSHNTFITTGDHAQVVSGDNYGIMAHNSVVPVAPGYEELAQNIQRFTEVLRESGLLEPEDRELLEETEAEALNELKKPAPDRKLLRRALAGLRGFASAMATGAAGGAVESVFAEVTQLAPLLQLPG